MKTIAAREAKNHFGRLIDMAHAGPVAIEKHGRPVVVMMSIEDYERLEACDDAYWIAQAEAGEASGYLGPAESERLLKKMRLAKG